MAFKIYKQFQPRQDDDPIWAQNNQWVAILPDGGDINNDKEDIYDTKQKADDEVIKKEDADKEKKPDNSDKLDKYGKKIKDRKYIVVEI